MGSLSRTESHSQMNARSSVNTNDNDGAPRDTIKILNEHHNNNNHKDSNNNKNKNNNNNDDNDDNIIINNNNNNFIS